MGDNTICSGGAGSGETVEKRGVYANLSYDKGFKIVFGSEENKHLLITLLNLLLKDVKITSLEYGPTEKVGPTEEESKCVFDVYCTDSNKNRFVVEMQMWAQHNFNKRAVYYCSYAIQDQAQAEKEYQNRLERKWDYNFPPVYVISFQNYRNDQNEGVEDSYVSNYVYRGTATGKYLNDGTNLVFIDLDKFRKEFDECETMLDKWLYSIKYIHTLDSEPEGIAGTELAGLYEAARKAKKGEETIKTHGDMGSLHDFYVHVQEREDEARALGLAEGLAEGEARGEAKGKAEGKNEEKQRILNLIKQGYTAEQLASLLCEPNEEYGIEVSK